MRIKLVALDIDGTLLTDSGDLTPRVRQTVRLVRSLGVEVVLATGRRLRPTLPVLHALGLEGAVITNNGALITDTVNWRVLHQAVLTPDQANAAVALCQQREAPWWAYRFHLRGPDVLVPLAPGPQRFAWPVDPQQWTCLAGPLTEPVLSLSTWGPTHQMQPLAAELDAAGLGAQVLYLAGEAPGDVVELLPPGCSKAAALAVLCDRLSIRRREVLAIGNGYNDVEMLQWAGLGIAMGNAPASVAAAAAETTLSNEQDGVAAALLRHVIRAERAVAFG